MPDGIVLAKSNRKFSQVFASGFQLSHRSALAAASLRKFPVMAMRYRQWRKPEGKRCAISKERCTKIANIHATRIPHLLNNLRIILSFGLDYLLKNVVARCDYKARFLMWKLPLNVAQRLILMQGKASEACR